MTDCMYCSRDQRVDNLMTEIVALPTCTVYYYREQSYPGRCVLVYSRHIHKITELSPKEFHDFFEDVYFAANVLQDTFHPDKINYLVLGDLSPHLHIHLVPKYRDGKDWGNIFHMMPQDAVFVDDEQYQARMQQIKSAFCDALETRTVYKS